MAALECFSPDELRALADNPKRVKKHLAILVEEEIAGTFASPLSDREVQSDYPQFAGKLAPWRKYAAYADYSGPIAWLVKKNFTLANAWQAGPCYSQLDYLKSWQFADAATEDCLVFWVPRLAWDSTSKSVEEMKAFRCELGKRFGLPDNHAVSFGSIQVLFALILAYFKFKGESVPFCLLNAASDSLRDDGTRLIAGNFTNCGLYCNCWIDDVGNDSIGFFLIGAEKLGK